MNKNKEQNSCCRSVYWRIGISAGVFVFLAWLFAIFPRIQNAFLEDDLVWMLPRIEHIVQTQPFIKQIISFHGPEMTLFNGLFYSFMLKIFGFNLSMYTVVLIVLFLLSVIVLFDLLYNRVRLSMVTSCLSCLMFLTFFGHFHAYLWSVAAHHIFGILFILLLINGYFRLEDYSDQGKEIKWLYFNILLTAFFASFLRLSILIAPFVIICHIILFTEDKKRLLRKLDLWLPVIVVICLYQIASVDLIEGQHALKDLLNNFHFEFMQGWLAHLSIFVGGLIVIRVLLGFFIRLKIFNRIQRIFQKSLYATVAFPHYIALCLFCWIFCIKLAGSLDAFQRWQLMSFPQNITSLILLMLIASIFTGLFIFHLLKSNTRLSVFIFWIWALIPFLGYGIDPIPSRYLIYASGVFSIIFIVVIESQIMSVKNKNARKIVQGLFVTMIVAVSVMNCYAIRKRLLYSTLTDYAWSYEYLKSSSLIANDMKEHEWNEDVCIKDVKPAPYLNEWGFLNNVEFDPFSPMRQSIKISSGNKSLRVFVNDECRSTPQYTMKDGKVYNADHQSLELFDHFLLQSDQSLMDEQYNDAFEGYHKALLNPPFLIRFVEQFGLQSLWGGEISQKDFPKVIRSQFTKQLQHDQRAVDIEHAMIQEYWDYAWVRMMYSFLAGKLGNSFSNTVDHYFPLLSDYEMLQMIASSNLPDNLKEEIWEFIKPHSGDMLDSVRHVSSYADFDIYYANGQFLAVKRGSQFTLLNYKMSPEKFEIVTAHHKNELIEKLKSTEFQDHGELVNNQTSTESFIYFEDGRYKIQKNQQTYVLVETSDEDIEIARAESLAEIKLILKYIQTLK